MQKAGDEMRAEMKKRQEEKENYLKSKVSPLSIDGLDDSAFYVKWSNLVMQSSTLFEI